MSDEAGEEKEVHKPEAEGEESAEGGESFNEKMKKEEHEKEASHSPHMRIIKKVKHGGGHHGGAWKIAYADFVTAMMAFFLLMWLLSLLDKYQLQGIAEYFKKPMSEAYKPAGPLPVKDQVKPDKTAVKPEPSQGSITQGKSNETTDKIKALRGGKSNSKTENNQPMQQKTILVKIKDKVQDKVEKDPILRQYRNIMNFTVTADGLKINLSGLENETMFKDGKSDLHGKPKEVLGFLAKELNSYPNQIVIIGHTDAMPAASARHSQWGLSAERADAVRRFLVEHGMREDKIMRIIGVGDKNLLNKKDGLDPRNNRIEIIVLTNDSAKKLEEE